MAVRRIEPAEVAEALAEPDITYPSEEAPMTRLGGIMRPMLITIDTEADATYISLSEAPVARTVEISDLLMVDLDAHGEVVGIELAGPVDGFPRETIDRLFDNFPALRSELKPVIARLAS